MPWFPDVYKRQDIKYDVFLDAKELGINLIDGDHFATENVVVPVLSLIHICISFDRIRQRGKVCCCLFNIIMLKCLRGALYDYFGN